MAKHLPLVFLLLISGLTKSWAGNPNSCSNPSVANLCGSGTFTVNIDTITHKNITWKVNGQTINAAGPNIYYQVNLPVSSYQPVSLQASLAGYFSSCSTCNTTIYLLWFQGSPCSSQPVAVSTYNIVGTSTVQDSLFSSYTIGTVQSTYYLVIAFSNSNDYLYNLQLGFTNNQPLPVPTCSAAAAPYKGQFAQDKSSCYTSATPYQLPLKAMNDNPGDSNVLYPLNVNQHATSLPINDDNGNGFILTIKTEDDQINYNEVYQSFDQFPYTYSASNFPYNYIYDVALTVFFKDSGGATGLKGFRMQIPGSSYYSTYTYPKSGVYNVGGNWLLTYDANSQTYTWLFRGTGTRGDNVADTGYSCEAYTFDAEITNLGNSIKAWYLPDNYGNDSTECVYGASVPPRTDCGTLRGDIEPQNWIALSGSAAAGLGGGSGMTGAQCGTYQSFDNGPAFDCEGNSYNNNYTTITYDANGCATETFYYYDSQLPDFTFSDYNLANDLVPAEYGGVCNGKPYKLALSGNGYYDNYYTVPSVLAYYDSTTQQYHPVDSLGSILYKINLNLNSYSGYVTKSEIPAYPKNSSSFTVPLKVKGTYTVLYFTHNFYAPNDTSYSYIYDCYPGNLIIVDDTNKLVFSPDTLLLCNGQTGNVSIPNVVSYTWMPSSTANGSQVYPTVNTSYTVMVTDQYGCSNTTDFKVRVVYCRPYIDEIYAGNGCPGLCTNFYSQVTHTPSNWQWTFYGGTPATYNGETPPQICYPKVGVYPFKLFVSDSAGQDSSSAYFQVGTCIPQASFDVDSAVCQSQGCVKVYLHYPENNPADQYIWSFPGATPSSYATAKYRYYFPDSISVCYPDTGTFIAQEIAYNFSSNINDTLKKTIHITNCGGNPVAAFSTNYDNICITGCAKLSNTSTGATSYQWNFTGSTPSTYSGQNPPNVCYDTIGTYTIQLIAKNFAGADTLTKTIFVNSCIPTAAFSINNDTICRTGCITLSDTSTLAASWQWIFAGGTPSTYAGQNPPNVCYNTAGSYTVRLIVSNNYGADTVYHTLVVNACKPTAAFSINNDTICRTSCLTLSNTSTGATGYQWSFVGGTPSTYSGQNPPNVCYNTAGSYTVQLIAANASASDTLIKTVLVNTCNPTAAFSANHDTICPGNCLTIINTSVNARTWAWSFQGGTPSSHIGQTLPSICYSTPGTYTIQLIVTNAYGSDTATGTVVVNDCSLPQAIFTEEDTICRTNCATITIVSASHVNTWSWSFPGGAPSAYSGQNPPNVCYNTTGSYTTQLIVGNNYGADTVYHTVVVNSCTPHAAFVRKDSICPGDCITITDTSSANSTNWQWVFNGGTPSTYNGKNPPPVCYAAVGNYAIQLIASNNYGSDTALQNITVYKYNAGNITATFDSLCNGNPALLTLQNSWGALQWQVSDTTTNFTTIPGATSGSYEISPVNQNTYVRVIAGSGNCADTSDILKLTSLPPLAGAFTWSIAGQTVSFMFHDSSGIPISFSWNFGDGDTASILTNPVHVYGAKDTTYYVCATVYDGTNCSYTYCKNITVGILTGVASVATATGINLYPNPAMDELTVEVLDNFTPKQIAIVDALGRTILQTTPAKTTAVLNVHNYTAGIYFVKIQLSDGSIQVRKFVKQ